MARRVVAANGCADRVEVLREWSYRVELPERADVVVSETLGSDPLEEGMLPSLADARRRLARPGARFLPGRVEILALPVEVPDDEGTRLLARANLAGWQERYGFDLGAVAEWQEASPGRQAALPVERARRFRALGPAVPLADFQPGEEESPPLEGICPWPPEAGALLVAFRAFLGPGNALSTVPDEAGDTHWALPLYLATGEGPRLRWSLAPGAERFERVAGSPGGPGPA